MSNSHVSRVRGGRWLPATLALGIFCVAGAAQAAPLVYTIKNNPSYQNGWTITGSVTTDGTVNAMLGIGNITAWSMTLTKPGNPTYTLLSTDVDSSTNAQNIYATPSELLLAFSANSRLGLTSIAAQVSLAWNRNAPLILPPLYNFPQEDTFSALNYPNNQLWGNHVPNGVLPLLSNASGDWIIASSAVPEIDPAGMGSVAALVTGCLGLLERRRRLRG